MNRYSNEPTFPHLGKRSAKKKSPGFSLVEFMVGSGVMTLVLDFTLHNMGTMPGCSFRSFCFSGLGQALQISENVKSGNFAAQILQSEMGEIHTLQWNEVNQLPSTGNFDPKAYFSIIPLRDYSCQRSITDLGSLQKEIRLTVSWTDLKGLSHDREYVTYYTKDGLYDYTYRAL